ncbi:MAG: RCC1 repeat-containing protein [Anaerolineae bacterium]|nr:RCC1 repeat-containing protein [Anaerolineae bacterium]
MSVNRVARLLAAFAVSASVITAFPAQGKSTDEAARQSTPSVLSARTLALGASHTCAITPQGGVKCWGRNDGGQLGDGTTENRTAPVDVRGLRSGVRAITAGAAHTCALMDSGSVKCWGVWAPSRIETERRSSTVPVDIPDLDRDVMAIAAGGEHTCALTRQGSVLCWGENHSGQLGIGQLFGSYDAPVQVRGLGGRAQAIAAGRSHTCALLDGGEIACWGENNSGQLGLDMISTGGMASPKRVQGLRSKAVAITAGAEHTCALSDRGEVFCWGDNREGQLGDGTPKRVGGVSQVVGLPRPVRQFSAGSWHTCAVLTDGSAVCWGGGSFGKLGNGEWINSSVPVAVSGLNRDVREVAVGGDHTCTVLSNNQVLCWGSNLDGQLGVRESGQSRVPANVVGLTGAAQAVAAGGSFTCALTQANGVRCWGSNDYGVLGNAGTTDSLTPVDVAGLSASVRAVDAGVNHACAVTTGGRVRCWGYNWSGQLGDGTTESRSEPVSVQGLSGVRAVAVGALHTCALLEAGNVRCWGSNQYGQLGEGTPAERRTPVADVQLGGSARAIAAGDNHTCALMTNGKVKCWGINDRGQLGNGSTMTRSVTPMDVQGLDDEVVAIDASTHTCALMRDGSVRCWGDNLYGALGDGTREDARTPVRVQGLSGKVRALALGGFFTCALLESGSVQCWGSDLFGQLGRSSAKGEWSKPGAVQGLAGTAQSISAGEDHVCAVLSSGAVQCWGRNFSGQLGNGMAGYRMLPTEVVSQ